MAITVLPCLCNEPLLVLAEVRSLECCEGFYFTARLQGNHVVDLIKYSHENFCCLYVGKLRMTKVGAVHGFSIASLFPNKDSGATALLNDF